MSTTDIADHYRLVLEEELLKCEKLLSKLKKALKYKTFTKRSRVYDAFFQYYRMDWRYTFVEFMSNYEKSIKEEMAFWTLEVIRLKRKIKELNKK